MAFLRCQSRRHQHGTFAIRHGALRQRVVSSRDVEDGRFAARLEAFGKVVETADMPTPARPAAWPPRAARLDDRHGAPTPRVDPAQHAAVHRV
jgi:hypothetical protein